LKLDQNGKPIGHITADSPAYQAIEKLLIKLLNLEKTEEVKK